MRRNFLKPAITALVLWLAAFSAFGQAPDITYTTPNVYIIGAAIPALNPSNTGGAVPATIYGETKVIAGTGQFGNANGDAATAQFKLPYGISMDADGNTYIAESGGGIRMISASGQVSSIATDALPGPPFNVPKLNNPRGVVKDKSGNLFVANYSNHNVLKITPSGIVTVFAGISQAGTADGPGNVANIINPNGIAIDKDDNLYVSDGNNAIRKISPSGYVYTLAGQPAAGTLDGIGPAAKFNKPAGLVVDKNGNIFVADQGGFVIRKITPNGQVTTIAGSGNFGTGNDGVGAAANFQYPVGITVDASGNLYVTDGGVGTVRRISPDGEVKTVAGGGPVGAESGVGTDVHFSSPTGITIGPDGNLYVAEYGKNSIKKVTATGYTIDKALPAGLVFDPKTGIISGTPTVLWPITNYTVTAYNAAGSSKFILSIEVDDVETPVISGSDVGGTITTCVGTASANYQMFTVSGTNLTNDAIVIAPANFEVSLTPVGGYSSTVTISLADLELPPDGDGVVVYVRSAATAPAGNLTGNVLLKSTGATDVQVPVSGVVNEIMTLEVSINQQILGCPNEQVILVALTPNPANNLNYQWYVNGNPRSNGVNFISSEVSSTDVITVTITNTVDCTTSPSVTSAPASPMYIPLATPVVTAEQPDLACPGQSVIFVANTHDTEVANSVYRWEINNIDQHNNGKTFPAPATITAADKVTVTMTNPSDCGPLNATSAPVSPAYNSQVPPIVTVDQPVLACPGQSVTFMANTHGTEDVNSVYSWQINNVDQSNHSKIFPAPATITAADKVTVTMTNPSDCGPLNATSAPVSPAYNSQVPPIVTVEQPDLACPGQQVIFVANTHGTEDVNSVYNWQVNNVDQDNHNKIFPAPANITAADKVTVMLTNSSDCGPLKATSVPVSPAYNTQPPPTVTISAPLVYPVCEGDYQTFTAVSPNSGSNPSYQWQLNHVNVGENKDKFTSNTLKSGDLLTCTISSPAQCTVPGTSNEVVIQTKVLPTVAFNGDVTIKKGESTILSPVLSNDVTGYSWSPSLGLSNSTVASPKASPAVTTTYTLTVTAGGCPASAIIKVNVLEQMVIPNTFTPNGDGVNDTWSIAGLAAYPKCTVDVFNRYGAGIFRSVGYAKNWNGDFNGYVLPSGTYYYVVDLKDGSKPLSGYVVLLK